MDIVEPIVVLALASHLICMNVASVMPLVAVWFERREAQGDLAAGEWGRKLLWQSLGLLLAGVGFGALAGFVLWNTAYDTALDRMWTKVQFGIAELFFSLVLILVQALWWRRPSVSADGAAASTSGTVASRGKGSRIGRAVLAFLSTSNLLYHFPILMVVMSRAAAGLDAEPQVLDAAAFRTRLVDPLILSRCLHFIVASPAITGAWMIAWAWLRSGESGEGGKSGDATTAAEGESAASGYERLAVWGARLALVPTLLQIPTGIWLLVAQPAHIQSRLMGGQTIPTVCFGLSVLLAMSLMHLLASISLGNATRPKMLRTLITLTTVVVLMTVVLRALGQ